MADNIAILLNDTARHLEGFESTSSRNGTRTPGRETPRVLAIITSNELTVNTSGLGREETDYEMRSRNASNASRDTTRSRHPSEDVSVEEGSDEHKKLKGNDDVYLFKTDNTMFSRRMTIAGGFLDIALFSANCEQLKSILEIKEFHRYYSIILGMLITSMVLQTICFMALFLIGCLVIKNPRDKLRGSILNHGTLGLIALITVINIFISTFNVKGDIMKECNTCLFKSRGMGSP